MRYIRYAFLGSLAVVLIAVALANRDMVTLTLLPAVAEEWFGINHAVQVPLFAVIFGAIVVGLIVGFVWEWLREHRYRADKTKAQKELHKTQREVRRLKGREAEKKDEVLTLLEEAS